MAGAKHRVTSEYLAGRTMETLQRQLEARIWDLQHGKLWYADVVERLSAEIEMRNVQFAASSRAPIPASPNCGIRKA